jgi:dTDP-4-dehydrorhamnose 3,5-epimerase
MRSPPSTWSTGLLQDDQSLSRECGTTGALPFSDAATPQAKLVRVLRGGIYDVEVDFRRGSPMYGRWAAETLAVSNGKQSFMRCGFASDIHTSESSGEVGDKVDNYFAPVFEHGLARDEPTLAINWPVSPVDGIFSDRDRNLGCLADLASPLRYGSSECPSDF